MAKETDNITVNFERAKDGLGLAMRALFDGFEGMLQSRMVLGEPMEIGEVVLIPLMEISAGMAAGSLQNNAHNNGASAMSVKAAPTAMLVIQNGKVRLVSVKNQDVVTRLLDMIPEAIDRLKNGTVSKEAVATAEKALNNMAKEEVEVIKPEAAEE